MPSYSSTIFGQLLNFLPKEKFRQLVSEPEPAIPSSEISIIIPYKKI
jgi:hypothetical protein